MLMHYVIPLYVMSLSSLVIPIMLLLPNSNFLCFSGKQPKILYANKHDIRLFTAGAPENETTLLGGLQGVVSVDFDWRSQKVFFTEVADVNEIRSFSLKKKKQQSKVVVDARTGRPSVIAIDWVTKKLYWTDDSRTRIELANFDGTHRKLLIDTNLDQPRALALLPQKG